MKKEEMFSILGEVDEQKVAAAGMAMTAKKKSRPVWLKWGAIAACLCLVVVGAVLPMMNNVTSTRNQEELPTDIIDYIIYDIDEGPAIEIDVVEVNGVEYVVCGKGEETILQECGIPTELTKDLAGEHVCYLGIGDNRYIPVEKADASEENNIELFEYAPEPNENVYIMCRDGEYFAAIRKDDSQTNQLSPESGSDSDNEESANAEEPASSQQESNVQMTESINPESFPTGEYHDDMGSQLIVSKVDDQNYTVTYGIYKLTYIEDAVGSYEANSGILSFSGTDNNGNILSANVTIQGDNLIVTLTHSEYPDVPAGTFFEFKPDQP